MNDQNLSESGLVRRGQILQLAHREARFRRRRRFTVRSAATVGVAGAALLFYTRSQPRFVQKPAISEFTPPLVAAGTASVLLGPARPAPAPSVTGAPVAMDFIQTDPTIADRLTLSPAPARWTVVDDHQLMQDLADAGEPMGMVYINGKMMLLPRHCSDAQ